jgi:hypothetical protein
MDITKKIDRFLKEDSRDQFMALENLDYLIQIISELADDEYVDLRGYHTIDLNTVADVILDTRNPKFGNAYMEVANNIKALERSTKKLRSMIEGTIGR